MSLSQNKNTLPILDPNIIPLDYQKLLLNGTSKQLKDNIIKLLNEINNLKKQNSEFKKQDDHVNERIYHNKENYLQQNIYINNQ